MLEFPATNYHGKNVNRLFRKLKGDIEPNESCDPDYLVNKNSSELKSLINKAHNDTIKLARKNKKSEYSEKITNHSFAYNAAKFEKARSDCKSIDKTILYNPKTEKRVSTIMLKSKLLLIYNFRFHAKK